MSVAMYTVYRTVYRVCWAYTPVMDTKTMGVRDLRNDLGHRVDAAHYLGEVTVVTSNGEPRAAVVPYAWLARLTGEPPPKA